jgi:hypothetical protein
MKDRRRTAALLVVIAIHVGLYLLLRDSAGWQRVREVGVMPQTRLTVRLIAAPTPKLRASPAVGEPGASAEVTAATRARPRMARATRREPDSSPAAESITPPTNEEAVATTPAASAPPSLPSIMDSEATRRAIRASARAPSLTDQLAQSREEPARLDAQARLARSVKEAGRGDCLKGEFAGAGMGLLSLPFLAAAAAAGNCAK